MVLKLTKEQVELVVLSHGMTPLFDEYRGTKQKLKVKCVCGDIYHMALENIRKGNLCVKCGYKNRNNRRIPYEEVLQTFKDRGCTLLVSKEDYVGVGKSLKYKCKCGHVSGCNYSNFRNGSQCKKCMGESLSGANHPGYKPNLTDEERNRMGRDRKYKSWSLEIKRRDNFTCMLCGDDKGGNLVSHHLNGYSDFPEQRYEYDNGVTLCQVCHKGFHDSFGYGGNTSEQFEQYVKEVTQLDHKCAN